MAERNGASRLRKLLAGRTQIVPGAYDALSAKLIERAGFKAVYVSGSAVSASLLGAPDLGLVTFTEMLTQVRYVVNSVRVPVICDADTGYGGPLNIVRTIQEMEASNIAGVQIEDQEQPKRCGHFAGKVVVPTEVMIQRIRAAVEARHNPQFVIIARTDARAVLGLEASIERARAYAAAGADVVFIEAPESDEELRLIGESVQAPLMVNMVEGGKTPLMDRETLESMGYRLILYPTTLVRAAMKAIEEVAQDLRQHGSTRNSVEKIVSFLDRNEITGLRDYEVLERRYASAMTRFLRE